MPAGLSIWFQYLVVFLTFLAVLSIIKFYDNRKRIFRLGRKLPGPKPWPIVGNALDFLDADLDILGIVMNYNKVFKGLFAVWLGPQLNVFINTAEDAEVCLLSPNVLDRGEKTAFLAPILGKGILVSSGPQWRKGRKIMEQAFHHSLLKDFVSVYKSQSDVLVKRLSQEAGKPSFPVLRYIEDCTFDITCEVTLELEIKAQKSEVNLLEKLDRLAVLAIKRLYRPWLYNDFIYQLFSEGREFNREIGELMELVKERLAIKKKIIQDEINNGIESKGVDLETDSKRRLFWRRLAEHFDDWGDEEVTHHAITMILTGFDTTANAIGFVLIMLGMHQDVQEKAYEEALLTQGEEFNEGLLNRLEYMDRVIKETFRLFPIIPLTFRKATEDIQIGKHLIPKGAEISVNLYAIHRDPRHFENPNEFNPDNFLPDVVAQRHPHAYIPFTLGQRKCIGGKFAMTSIKVVISTILLNYKIECDYKMDKLKIRDDVALRMTDGYKIRLIKREESS